MAGNTERAQAQEGKFLPLAYEARIVDAVNVLCVLRKFFASFDEVELEAGERDGIAWILTQAINELYDTALNCENGRKA